MENSKNFQIKSKLRQITGRLISSLRWLTKPASSLPESLINQSVLLGWTLLMLIPLALVTFIVIPPEAPRSIGLMILVLVFVLLIAFIANRMGHYWLSAALTILGGVIAPWGSLFLDPAVLQGDFMPLNFVAIPVLLSSVLLPPVITALIAGIQLAVLAYVLSLMPVNADINWIRFFGFIIMISAVSILTSILRQRNKKQIAHQKRQLLLSEAKLLEQSIRDYLTGLYNRRYLDETLEREIRRAERTAFPVGIIMLDIDNFKPLNDTFGHAAGDLVLQEIASLLKAKIRFVDIICRYGGEEFVVVMPEASLNATLRRAEIICEEVKKLDLHLNNQNLGKITISSGVAVFPNHGATAEAVMKSADSAMYTAKESGRDRVVVAS